jgi:hypothetical protein
MENPEKIDHRIFLFLKCGWRWRSDQKTLFGKFSCDESGVVDGGVGVEIAPRMVIFVILEGDMTETLTMMEMRLIDDRIEADQILRFKFQVNVGVAEQRLDDIVNTSLLVHVQDRKCGESISYKVEGRREGS